MHPRNYVTLPIMRNELNHWVSMRLRKGHGIVGVQSRVSDICQGRLHNQLIIIRPR